MFLLKKIYATKWMRQMRLTGLFGLLSVGVYAQNITVKGTVSDKDGPLVGVSVQQKGTSVGTVTNLDGEYSIAATPNATLVFSFIGMIPQEIPVGGKNRIDVTLSENATMLEDVVVIGYGTLQKKMVTSAVTSISAKDLITGVGGATVANAMKGKISGLLMSGNDSPNTTNDLQLRGMASLENSQAPLVIIDGVPGGDIRSVVQEDIQSIDVLKDASAGAIYGTRATGGVIIITTKRAQDGKARISYTGETTYKQTFGKPQVLSAREYLKFFPSAYDYEDATDWWDAGLSDNPISNKHLISMSGGNESAKIYANVMYEQNNGILRGDLRTDYAGHVNANFKALQGWVDLNTIVDYRQADRNDSKTESNLLMVINPTRSIYDRENPSGYNIWSTVEPENNVADAALNTNNTLQKWFRPVVDLTVNILPVKGLTFHVTGSYENQQEEIHKYTSMYSTAQVINQRKGEATLKFAKTDRLNTESYLSFARAFDEHYLSAVAGYSYYVTNGESFEMENANFSVDGIKYWDITSGTDLKAGMATMKSNKSIQNKLLAYFGRAHYNWKEKYMAMATIRREGSSKFAPANSWGTFWSLSGGWRISAEDFMQTQKWISDLKLRAGYGVTGNEGFKKNYRTYLYSLDYFWTMPSGETAPGIGVAQEPSPTLQWEEKHEWNIGLDYSLFNDRLFGKFDVYQRNIEKLLYEVDVPNPPHVVNRMYENIATLVNRGWEFEIGAKIVKTADWDYETSINLSHNYTGVTQLTKDKSYKNGDMIIYPNYQHRLQVGEPVGSFYLFRDGGFISNPDGKTKDFAILDTNGNPILQTNKTDDNLRAFVGNYTPLLTAGWTHSLKYKQWALNMTLTSWIDFDIFNGIDYYNGYAPLTSGTRPYNRLKAAFYEHKDIRINNNPAMSDYFLEDGTFLKIQNVSVSYTLNAKRWSKDIVDNIRIYLTGNNLYTFTKYSGYNPEVNITGWQGGVEDKVYPQTRSYALGVQFNF